MGKEFPEIIMEIEPCLREGKRQTRRRQARPDGYEAWGVAIAACFINFIMAGLNRTSGVLYVAFIERFHADRMQASLPTSVRSSTRNLLGPVVGILGQKYGVRLVTITGAIIGALSAIGCFFVENIMGLTIVWGVLSGIGMAMSTTLAQVIINQHFEKYLSTATGVSYSGGCFGSLVFPTLIEYTYFQYDLEGTFLIIAGTILNVIPAAMILKKPSWLIETKPKIVATSKNGSINTKMKISEREGSLTVSDINVNDVPVTKVLKTPNVKCFSEIEATCGKYDVKTSRMYENDIDGYVLLENRTLVMHILTDGVTVGPPSNFDKYTPLNENALIKEIEDLFCNIAACYYDDTSVIERDLTDSVAQNGKVKNSEFEESLLRNSKLHVNSLLANPINLFSFYLETLFRRGRNNIMQSFSEVEHEQVSKVLDELQKIHNILSRNKNNKFPSAPSTTSLCLDGDLILFDDSVEVSNTFSSHIKTALNLHTKPMFLLIYLCRSVHFLTFIPLITIIVDFTIDKGLPAQDGKFLIGALAAGDLFGRLCLGWITDKNYMSLPRFMLCFMVLHGFSNISLAFVSSKISLMIVMIIFSLLQGSIFVRHTVLISLYLKNNEQFIANGCINFFSGVIGLLLPSYIGYFRDTIGSYNGMLYINGCLAGFIGLLWILEPYLVKLEERRAPLNNQTPV